MATVIRFARYGKKRMPFFRIVVQDKRSPRDGRFIEHIGSFDPSKGRDTLVIERARLEYWLGTGAQMSDTVKSRLKRLASQGNSSPVAPPTPTESTKKTREA